LLLLACRSSSGDKAAEQMSKLQQMQAQQAAPEGAPMDDPPEPAMVQA
jgi:hypothetical protein